METILQHADIEPVLVDSDIGGTTDTTKYVEMKNFDQVTFVVYLGNTFEGTATNWNAADALDAFKLVQATDAAGTSSKDITGATNDQTAVGAAGNAYAITIHAAAMDMANSFDFVAATVGEDDNTGTDNVTVIAARYHSRYKQDNLTVVNETVL
jgi:hypothetical protein